MTSKENYLKAVHFDRPEYIPMSFVINGASWQHYDQDWLFTLMEQHKFLFPDFVRPEGKFVPDFGTVARKDKPFTDDFGCVWQTSEDGITGTVVKHPLEDWNDFPNYKIGDYNTCMGIGKIDWKEFGEKCETRRKNGELVFEGLRHGHTFLQLCDIRGYQNLLFDFADEEPRINQLIAMVEEFNMGIVKHTLECGVDVMSYAEDLGMQTGPMLSPEQFKKYIKPSYRRLIQPAKEAGAIIHMHSDGDIRLLADDIIDGGVEILNLQDLVNGIEWIRDAFYQKTCIDLDIDRQNVTAFGTPEEVDELIKTEVERLGSKQGGLMMVYGLYPGIPPKNVEALMDAMEKYAFYYDN